MGKLLIADPDEIFTAALSRKLTGHDVHICHTGADAIDLLHKLHPDILVINLCLPKTDGFTVLRQLQNKPHIIALTPIVTVSIYDAAVELGVDILVPIPCTADHIAYEIDLLTKEMTPSLEV